MTGAADLLLSLAVGWLAVRCLLGGPAFQPRWSGFWLEAGAAVGVGAGLASTLQLVSLCAGFATAAFSLGSLTAVGAALALLLIKRRPSAERSANLKPEAGWWTWALRAVSVAVAGLVLAQIFGAYAAEPHGWWDAFSIWNLRARFLASAGPTWRSIFTMEVNSGLTGASHPGYPLLLSGWVAHVWTAAGSTSSWIPAVIGALFGLGTLMLLVSAVSALRGETAGILAALVVAATGSFVEQSAWQIADIPVAYFVLGSTAMLALAQRRAAAGTAALCGVMAGLLPWTKNEGWPFLLALIPVAFRICGKRGGLFVTLGALPGALTTLLFKLTLVQGRDSIIPASAADIFGRLGEPARWGIVASALLKALIAMGPLWAHPIFLLVVLALVLRFIPEWRKRAVLAVPALLVPASAAVMVLVTSADVAWQATSAPRLILQPWPALVLIVFLSLKRAEDFAESTALKAIGGSPSKKARRQRRRR